MVRIFANTLEYRKMMKGESGEQGVGKNMGGLEGFSNYFGT